MDILSLVIACLSTILAALSVIIAVKFAIDIFEIKKKSEHTLQLCEKIIKLVAYSQPLWDVKTNKCISAKESIKQIKNSEKCSELEACIKYLETLYDNKEGE